MVRLRIYLLFLLLFPSTGSLGQFMLKGTVAKPDGNPLSFANVLLLDRRIQVW